MSSCKNCNESIILVGEVGWLHEQATECRDAKPLEQDERIAIRQEFERSAQLLWQGDEYGLRWASAHEKIAEEAAIRLLGLDHGSNR